jgi:hypothetical protein
VKKAKDFEVRLRMVKVRINFNNFGIPSCLSLVLLPVNSKKLKIGLH